MITTIQQTISLEAEFYDSNIEKHILNKLKSTMEGTCTLKYGYILQVLKLINIYNNSVVTSNPNTLFFVKYNASILKPKEGLELSGRICMVFPNGILADVENKVNIFIPITNMKDYTFNDTEKKFVCEGNSVSYEEGMIIDIIITSIKYEKKNYIIIGKIKNIEKT